MAELPVPGVRFDGLGATAGGAAEASRVLAERLNHWVTDHPTSRILDLQVHSTSIGAELHLTAIIAHLEDEPVEDVPVEESTAVAIAQEIVADAQHDA